jgi:predicted metal-binding membrane protein
MTDTTLETVLRRDGWIVGGAIAILVALAWAYVLWLANDMDMGGMDDGWNDGALGGTNDPHVRPRGATGEG